MLGRMHGQNLARACLNCTASLSAIRVSSSTDFGRRSPRVGGILAAGLAHGRTIRCAHAFALQVEDGLKQTRNPKSSNDVHKSLTFQEAIVQLQKYWSSVGCTLWQPHNSEVNALYNRIRVKV